MNVDHRERETLVVTEPGGEVIAFGQYVGLDHADDPGGAADIALAVADAWQGRGLGRTLARGLLAAAADAGFTVVTASVLADNRPALADRFRPREVHPQGPTVEVQLDLDAPARPSTTPRNRHAC